MTTEHRATTGLAVFLLSLPVFAVMGAILMAPLLPSIEADFAGAAHVKLLVPLLLTTPALCLALLSPIAGAITDRIGARRVILVSMLVYGIAGTAPMYLQSLGAIFASRLIVGVAEAGIVTASAALLGLCYNNDACQKWFALQSVLLPLFASIIVALTGWIGDYGWRLAFVVYGSCLLALPLAWMLLPRTTPSVLPGIRPSKNWPPIRTLVLIACIAIPGSIFFYIGPVQIAYLLAHRGFDAPSTAALVTSIGLIAGPPVVLLTRRMRHLSVGLVIGLGMVLMAVGMILMATGTSPTMITLGLVIQQGGGGIMYSTALAYTVSLAAPGVQGAYSGAFYFIYMLAQFATPLITSTTMLLIGDRTNTVIACAGAAVVTGMLLMTIAPPLRRPLVVTTPAAH